MCLRVPPDACVAVALPQRSSPISCCPRPARQPTCLPACLPCLGTLPLAGAIYIDRWVRSGRRTTQYLNIRSSLVLTKPLVIGTFIRIDIAAGVTLSLAAQPALPRREVFTGPGAVRFVPPQSVSGGAAAPAEFDAMPEWWRGSSDSDRLEALSAACSTFPGVQCRVVLTGAYKLIRPWRVTPSLLPWASPITSFEWVGPVGGGQGVLFAAGAYNPRRRLFLPRMFKFDDWAVKLEGEGGCTAVICISLLLTAGTSASRACLPALTLRQHAPTSLSLSPPQMCAALLQPTALLQM